MTCLQPKLEDVVVSAALDDLVSGVVAHVVVLVTLKQVVRRHLVATDQQALSGISRGVKEGILLSCNFANKTQCCNYIEWRKSKGKKTACNF